MSMNANDRYLEATVMSASPLELVRMLYRRALGAAAAARRHLAEGDIRARSREISTAMEIAVELAGSLDREKGGDVALHLAALYDYIGTRLLEANLHQDDAALAEVERLLATLDEGWAGIHDARTPAPAPSRQEFAAPTAGPGYGYTPEPVYTTGSQCWSA
jgi:flagellar protein FliS